MTVAASGLYMNWTGVTVTHGTAPTTIAIDEVTDMDFGREGEVKRWSADAAKFAKALVVKNKRRTVTIKGGDVAKLASVPEDTPCTVVGILNDLNNGAGTGALTCTVTNAVCVSNPFRGKNNDFGTGDLSFEAFAPDGITDPLTITPVA